MSTYLPKEHLVISSDFKNTTHFLMYNFIDVRLQSFVDVWIHLNLKPSWTMTPSSSLLSADYYYHQLIIIIILTTLIGGSSGFQISLSLSTLPGD